MRSNWKGGIRQGRAYVYSLNHPYTKDNRVLRSRLVMEKKIGRYLLPTEVVHHLDWNKLNDSPDNLYLFKNNSEHRKHHAVLIRLVMKEAGIYRTKEQTAKDCYKKNKKHYDEYRKNWRKNHKKPPKEKHIKTKEEIRLQILQIKEYHKKYNLINREKLNKQNRIKYHINLERERKRGKIYRDKYKEKLNKHKREYHKKNRERINERHRKTYYANLERERKRNRERMRKKRMEIKLSKK